MALDLPPSASYAAHIAEVRSELPSPARLKAAPIALRTVRVPLTPPIQPAPALQGTVGGDPAVQEHVLGDWFGARTALKKAGIAVSVQYLLQGGYSLSGGTRSIVRQAGQFSVGATFDMNKIASIKGGTFQFLITNRNGKSLDKDAGLALNQVTQAVYGGGEIWRLSQMWYEQKIGNALFKVGRASVAEDFATSPCFFQSLYFCGIAVGHVAPNYWYNPPIAVWGGRVRLYDHLGYTEAGVYEHNPDDYPNNKGFNLGIKNAIGAILPVERAFIVNIGGDPSKRGIYKFGVWYDTSDADDLVKDIHGTYAALTRAPAARRHGQWGGYIVVRQQLHAPDKDGKGRLLVDFSTAFTDKRTSKINNIVTLAAEYSGILPTRPKDEIGLALGRTHVNGRLTDLQELQQASPNIVSPQQPQHSEYAIELTYSLAAAEGLRIRPNLQWYINPGARSSRKTISVLGASIFVSM